MRFFFLERAAVRLLAKFWESLMRVRDALHAPLHPAQTRGHSGLRCNVGRSVSEKGHRAS